MAGGALYVTETPHYLGQFPVLARAVLRGDLQAGAVVAARRVELDDIFRGIDARSEWTASGGWEDEGDGVRGGTLETPPETIAMGRVTFEIGEGLMRSARSDWDGLWDRDAGIVESITGELTWNTAGRFVEISSPRTQGVVGFAGGEGRRIETDDVEFDVETGFVSLLVTSLDDLPIADSAHLLVTAMARDRQTGARYSADGARLEAVGGPPLLIEPVRARLRLGSGWSGDAVGRPLDALGVPVETGLERTPDGWFVIDGRYRAFAYEIRRTATAPTEVATATAPTPPMPTTAATATETPPPAATGTGTAGTPAAGHRAYLPRLERSR